MYNHFILFQDTAGSWCAAPPGFRDLTLDPTGWGPTPEDAIAGLLDHPEFQEMVQANSWSQPRWKDFEIVPEPPGAVFRFTFPEITRTNIRVALRRQAMKLVSNG